MNIAQKPSLGRLSRICRVDHGVFLPLHGYSTGILALLEVKETQYHPIESGATMRCFINGASLIASAYRGIFVEHD